MTRNTTHTRTTRTAKPHFTTPGLDPDDAAKICDLLQDRLNACTDLHLTLKHVHWNVVGPHFIGVHQMIDPQVETVRLMSDELAERIATLGGSPVGTPGALVASRSWEDYDLRRASTQAHLARLDLVYDGVVKSHRDAMQELEELDPVTQDIIIEHLESLEQFHWFIRAHLEDHEGRLSDEPEHDEPGQKPRA